MTRWREGTELGPFRHGPVVVEDMAAFATVLADPNPIHTDGEAARAVGLGPRPVNQGPANFGYIMTMLRRAVPGAAIVDLDVRLTANVVAGDQVVAAGRVEAAGDDGRLTCAVWLDVDGGARAVDGTATLRLSASEEAGA